MTDNTTKPTPGPWPPKLRPNGTSIETVDGTFVTWITNDNHVECMRYLRLFASAPELLEALRKLADFPLKDFGGRRNPNHPIYGFNEWILRVHHIEAARAAIAKATGATP